MHQIVGSHNCNGAGCDHKSLEDIGVELPPFTAAAVQALHCITQQGLVLMEGSRDVTPKSFKGNSEQFQCFKISLFFTFILLLLAIKTDKIIIKMS